jgi:uncharacterized protein (TIGR00369 family)
MRLASRMADPQRYALEAFFGDNRSELAQYIPHCRRLGMQVIHTGPREATVRLPYRDELIGDPERGVVFGGVITTLLDHASGLAVSCSLAQLTAIATLDLRIDYLRAAEPGCDLTGRAECYKIGAHVAFVRGTAWDRSPDQPFASMLATMMLGANASPSAMARAVRERSGA